VNFGRIRAAGRQDGPIGRDDILSVGQYFKIAPEKLQTLLVQLEASEHPEIALLQNPDGSAEVKALCFVSSAWSHSYRRMSHVWSHSHTKMDSIYARIYRDFYYQCYFTAMELLYSVGCEKIHVESLLSGYVWGEDALLCLFEVQKNVLRLINPCISVHLWGGEFEQATIDGATSRFTDVVSKYGLPNHRPVAIAPYVSDGINMIRIFLRQNTTTNREQIHGSALV